MKVERAIKEQASFRRWLREQIPEGRGRDIARKAKNLRGEPLPENYFAKLFHDGKFVQAEHAIRIARALKEDILKTLWRAGFVSEDELQIAGRRPTDSPALEHIWARLSEMTEEELDAVEYPVTANLENEIRKRSRAAGR